MGWGGVEGVGGGGGAKPDAALLIVRSCQCGVCSVSCLNVYGVAGCSPRVKRYLNV